MLTKSSRPIHTSAVADFLGAAFFGDDRQVLKPCTLRNPCDGGLAFAKTADNLTALPREFAGSLTILAPPGTGVEHLPNISIICVRVPRFAFAKVMSELMIDRPIAAVAPTARVHPDCVLGQGVSIGEYSVIGRNCRIGDGTVIGNHVVIANDVVIGRRCVIKSGSVLGEEGFGIVKDESGHNYRLPHIGGVVLGDDVEIGALNTVCAGTLDPTIIEDFVKTDDHVHIAHNCVIGRDAIVTSCSSIAGSTKVEEDVWLGPNCSIMNGIVLGRGSTVGLGAVVMTSCAPNSTLSGYPARQLPRR
ncbi:MAG: transferase [Gammaproteobacteria bacterium]|nr:transferase [Gammaproteobacteria bacterium]